MNIWNLTKKDLAIFFRDRGSLIWLFLLPLVFILIFAGLAGMTSDASGEGQAEDTRPPLVLVNLDQGGESAEQLVQRLSAPDAFRLIQLDEAEAQNRVSKYAINRYLLIPAGFSSDLLERKPVTLTLITHPNSNADFDQTVMRMVNGVARDLSLELQILDGIQVMGQMQAANPASEQAFSTDKVMAQAKSQFDNSRETPLLDVEQVVPAQQESETGGLDLGKSILPGMSVLFVFLASIQVARNIYEERLGGSLRRLLAAPMRISTLLLGKMVPMLILLIIQITFIFLAGGFLLPLLGFGQLGIGNDPLALVLVSLAMAICSVSLGTFIAAIGRSEGQITGFGNALLWVAGFVGGAIVPAFILQQIPALNIAMRFVPHSWAATAYYDLLARGRGLVDVLPNIGMLLLFSAVFFYFGLRRFKFE